ncbi:hypothetical protein C900_03592 [Fulvivirga imtechensis AK7]|uniref:N-acetyltransferase domain-containing protein n=1 Tax=Fulvivirga imtechensis AK7 TaxID=1237149 RepID=L8JNS0_9BACT|nr:GNAT family N-acetyltransferase [Fulvivirga imtechensis]ELR70611.1 hypothetical protein C900_03592 [Fulvivirga imtechensis AK7]
MEFRAATNEDVPKIVELLRTSLGESLMPKSQAYWEWKHVRNPFGASPMILALEGKQLIGVRAFMNWQWMRQGKTLSAIRAVDTATHPDHQGKGIFKKLTLQLLEQCRKKGVDFVFNTPNSQSMPGYIKMGWKEAGKLPVKMCIKQPVTLILNKLRHARPIEFLELNTSDFDLVPVLSHFDDSLVSDKALTWRTPQTKAFLTWRYIDVPMVKYYGYRNDNALIVFRLKRTAYGSELRVVETIGTKPAIEAALRYIFFKVSFDYMTLDGFNAAKLPGMLRLSAKIGPVVTVRALNFTDLTAFAGFNSWTPCLGDMELF